ncbi:VOC family protein [Pseudoroseicyclus sp. CXY001]|uniref:VOC family protein n=1 Tax=Pseudoroseicyclus sp. CXY001 TaxID=3242492 RepID=UPI0035711107
MTMSAGGAYLHHIHIGSPDPARLAAFYADHMQMVAEEKDGAWHLAGPDRRLRISEGPAKSLLQAGFAAESAAALDALRERAEAGGCGPEAADEPLFREGAFAVTDPDGNRVVFGLSHREPAPEGHFIHGPLQHLTLATKDVEAIEGFYGGILGFEVSDRVLKDSGEVATCFLRSNHEHHTLACFKQDRTGMDHHSYEAGQWDTIRDWSDHFAGKGTTLMWGPGRHGPGNNLFIFIKDPDENWIEVSAELEVIHDRPVKDWPHAERTLNLWGRAIMRS